MNRLLEAALGYARSGYPVFPVQEGEKRPHPRLAPNGFKNATLDSEQIAAWWRACPRCGIGLALPAGTIALDFDGGREGLDAFLREFPELRAAPLQKTAKRGFHLVMRLPVPASLPGRVERWGGVDLKQGAKGYLVVAPSEVGGGRYEWVTPLPALEALPEAPPKLLDLLAPPPPPAPARLEGAARPSASPSRLRGLLDYHASRVAAAAPGSRHNELLRRSLVVAGLIPLGLDRGEAEAALREAGLAAGLPPREVEDLLRWALPRGEARPLPLEEDFGPRGAFWAKGLAQNPVPSWTAKTRFWANETHQYREPNPWGEGGEGGWR